MIVNIQLSDSASLDRTYDAALRVERIARETPGVGHTVTNSGMSFLLQANSPNFASMFVVLKPFSERQKEWYQLTGKSLAALRAEGVPDDEKPPEDVIAKLAPLRNKPEVSRDDFVNELAGVLASDELERFQAALLKVGRVDMRDTAIMAKLRERWLREVPDAQVTVFGAAPVPGLGSAGGFKFMVEDRGGSGVKALEEQMDKLVERFKKLAYLSLTTESFQNMHDDPVDPVPEAVIAKLAPLKDRPLYWTDFEVEIHKLLDPAESKQYLKAVQKNAEKRPYLADAKTQFRARTPQLYLEVDRAKAASLGVSVGDLNQTISMYLGSLYVNSYNDFGRHWQVTVQAEGAFRARPEQIQLFQVRNASGIMIPLNTLVKVRDLGGPISVTRYNLYTAAPINGNVQPGVSDGDAIAAISQEANDALPLSMRIEWTELMYLQILAGDTAIYVFLLSVVSVFLALSALYESWSLPLAVILVVPLCLLCSVSGVLYAGKDVNIFVQIGLVVLVGLACKNAILIVEFAKHLHQQGASCYEATREASRLRLRPIVMTSFAFIFGVIPLMFASGAGAEMRRSLGVAVFSGMLGVTLFGIFLTPVFFYVIQGTSELLTFRFPRLGAGLSYAAGATFCAAFGYLANRLDPDLLSWLPMARWVSPIVGGLVGLLIIHGIRGFRTRLAGLRPFPAAFGRPRWSPPATPPSLPPGPSPDGTPASTPSGEPKP